MQKNFVLLLTKQNRAVLLELGRLSSGTHVAALTLLGNRTQSIKCVLKNKKTPSITFAPGCPKEP